MKKSLLFTFVLSVIYTLRVAAAGGGPDTYGYIWKDSNEPGGPVYNWFPIETYTESIEVKLLSDDNNRGPFPFINFHFYWYDPTLFWVGSNGYIAFGNTQIASPFPNIPATSNPNNFCAVFTADLNFDGVNNPAKCYFWKSNDNDTLIVSWLDVPFWMVTAPSYTGANTFQVIFSTVDSSITYQYKDQQGTTNTAAMPWLTSGIENISGSIGLMPIQNAYPPVNYAIKYYYPANTTYQVSDAATNWNDNPDNGGLVLIKGSTFTMNTEVKNVGNQNLNSFNVLSRVLNSSSSTMVTSTVASNALTPGQTQQITHSSPFMPIVSGTYRYVTDTQLPGDATPSNNSKTVELVVVDTAQAQIRFSFDDNLPDATGLSWQGGGGGAGVYYIPPFYPCKVEAISIYIMDNPNLSGFRAQLYDDDGTNNSAGALLADTSLGAGSIVTGAWNDIVLDTPVVITSGGFYAAWIMEGDGIVLGVDQNAPLSNRTFEVLGSSWAIYRNGSVEDLMINVTTSVVPDTSSGIGFAEHQQNLFNLYPNPANDRLTLTWKKMNGPVSVSFYNSEGTHVSSKTLNNNGTNGYDFDISALKSGMYFVRVVSPDGTHTQKIIKK